MEVYGVRSWFDQREGVVVVEDDVQNIVRGIKEISDRLHVFYNPQHGGFDVVESCLDGTDRFVMSASELDNRVLDRLRNADHWHGQDTPEHVLGDDEDFVAQIDEHNEAIERAIRDGYRDKLGDVGERLIRTLDNVSDRPSVGGTISVPRSLDG
jgi:hypothetical protein